MSQATSANSVVKAFVAGGTINPGHGVYISAANTVIQDATGGRAIGIYIGDADAASGDNVAVCLAGPCRAWADAAAAITVNPPCQLSVNASGHVVVNTADRNVLIGKALEPLASGTAFIEIMVAVSDSSHA